MYEGLTGMSVTIRMIEGPLPPTASPWSLPGQGALVTFEGIARPIENGRLIQALEYEAYEPMASKMLERIGQQLVAEHGLIGISVEHSVGRVPAGERSLRLRVASYHRKEALTAMDRFIDRLKLDVPIWKAAVHEEPTD